VKDICNKPLTVFDEEVVQFLGDLSAEILKSPLARQYPDLSAFAFYARKANLQKLKDELNLEYGRLGRGLCFHVTPANIPINFAFSWMFSLLAGNANVVRLPSKPFPQVDALLSVIQAHLTRNQKLETRNRFVRYPRTDNETTAMYSAMADCRMIWGGDRTIAAIKTLPTRPRCVDICFADRYSVALINADAVMVADDAQMTRLVEGFYNDTYLMDQNACSSPQVILWEVGKWGSGEVEKARERFWASVEDVAKKKYVLQDAVAVDKYTLFCEEAVRNVNIKSVTRNGNLLYRVDLKSLPSDIISHRGKAGFFFEYILKSRDEFFAVVTEKFQTITQFGVDTEELRGKIVERGLRGIDRIVPIGQAMNIGVIWDGCDLVRSLSRIITVV
jgi:hypothetical protein